MPIRWAAGLKVAAQKAREMNWNLYVDFFSPTCAGCKTLESVTYSDGRVDGELSKDFVPLRADIGLVTDLAEKWLVNWTPTLLFLDSGEREHHRVVGYLASDELIGHLYLARGKIAFNNGRYDDAMARFKYVMERHPKFEMGAEAQYWYAIAKYRRLGNKVDVLKEGWKVLRLKFPDSPWSRKASYFSP